MRRILFLSATSIPGGAELSLLDLIGALDRDRAEPLLASPEEWGPGRPPPACSHFAAPIPRLRRRLCPFAWWSQWRQVRAARGVVAELVRAEGVDQIHANSVTAAMSAVGCGVPVTAHVRDLRIPWPARMLLKGRVRLWVATSQATARAARAAFGDCVRVVANGIGGRGVRHLFGDETSEEIPDPCSAPRLLNVGHLIPWKRHELFLQVMARVREVRPEVTATIAGGDPFGQHPGRERQLKALAGQLGMEDAVTWAGVLPREEMAPLYDGATVLVHTARGEPFGRVLVEAMLAGVPVVAHHSGGPAEILAHGGGRLVASDEPEHWARVVLSYLEDSALCRQDGERGLEVASSRYTAERMARAFERVVLAI